MWNGPFPTTFGERGGSFARGDVAVNSKRRITRAHGIFRRVTDATQLIHEMERNWFQRCDFPIMN